MGKSAPSYSERPLSDEEKKLLETQSTALTQSMTIALDQFNLSQEDRNYFTAVFRGEVNTKSPVIQQEIKDRFSTVLQDAQGKADAKISELTAKNDTYQQQLDTISKSVPQVNATAEKAWIAAKKAGTNNASNFTNSYDWYKSLEQAYNTDVTSSDAVKYISLLPKKQEAQYDGEGNLIQAATSGLTPLTFTQKFSELQKEQINKLKSNMTDITSQIAEAKISAEDSQKLYDSVQQEIVASKKTGEDVNTMLFNAVKNSDTVVSTALSKWAKDTESVASKLNVDIGKIIGDYSKGISEASSNYEAKMQSAGQKYETTINNLGQQYNLSAESLQQTYKQTSDKLLNTFNTDVSKYMGTYQDLATKTAQTMGTADTDIYARTKGALTAGISSSYAEARKQLESTLARRGLAGTAGVEAGALTSLSTQEAMAKTGALSQAYTTAVSESDVRRQANLAAQANVSQLGIGASQTGLTAGLGVAGTGLEAGMTAAGNVLQTGVTGATSLYGGETTAAGNIYSTTATSVQQQAQMEAAAAQQYAQTQTQIAAQQYQAAVAQQQQNVANLSQLSGISQGVYTGAQNYLSGAAATTSNVAQTSGSTATQLGSNAVSYYNAQASAAAQESAGVAGALGTVAAAGVKAGWFSDIRFKNNIILVENRNGINIYTWEWNDFAKEYGVELYEPKGVIAQELVITYPELVGIDENGYYYVDYQKLISMIGGI